MAAAKEKQEGKANEAETIAAVTEQEKTEDKANKLEAAETEQKRKQGQIAGETSKQFFPADHNGQNRRITSILRESRRGKSMETLRGENRKLKNEVRRMQAEQTAKAAPGQAGA
mgnify:CR=1 FL=1